VTPATSGGGGSTIGSSTSGGLACRRGLSTGAARAPRLQG